MGRKEARRRGETRVIDFQVDRGCLRPSSTPVTPCCVFDQVQVDWRAPTVQYRRPHHIDFVPERTAASAVIAGQWFFLLLPSLPACRKTASPAST